MESSLYLSLDSDNNNLRWGGRVHCRAFNSSTTTGFQETGSFNDIGEAIIQANYAMPLLDTASGHLTVQPAVDLLLNRFGAGQTAKRT